MTNLEKAHALFSGVKSRFKWDETYRPIPDKSIYELESSGIGSCGEINLFLYNSLYRAGLDVYVVLSKMRSTGILPLSRATASDINYLTVLFKDGENSYFLDATEDFIPFGMLPERCINGKGLVIKDGKGNFEWIDLIANSNTFAKSVGLATLTPEGGLNGTFSRQYSGYFGYDIRKKWDTESEHDFQKKNFQSSMPSMEIISDEIINIDDCNNDITEKYEFKSEEFALAVGDKIYFAPVWGDIFTKNPFRLEKRNYPVDYAHPFQRTFVMNYILPEGYTIESVPEPIRVSLPNKAGSYVYNVTQLGNQVNVIQIWSIQKSIFTGDEYEFLKKFYEIMINKQKEQIVLKSL